MEEGSVEIRSNHLVSRLISRLSRNCRQSQRCTLQTTQLHLVYLLSRLYYLVYKWLKSRRKPLRQKIWTSTMTCSFMYAVVAYRLLSSSLHLVLDDAISANHSVLGPAFLCFFQHLFRNTVAVHDLPDL